jgi:hypothetical protein
MGTRTIPSEFVETADERRVRITNIIVQNERQKEKEIRRRRRANKVARRSRRVNRMK